MRTTDLIGHGSWELVDTVKGYRMGGISEEWCDPNTDPATLKAAREDFERDNFTRAIYSQYQKVGRKVKRVVVKEVPV